MHPCSTVLVLLFLTWAEKGSCTVCNGKALTYEKRELFALYDKIEAAIGPLLPSKELKDVVHDINEKIKARLCDVNIEGRVMQEIIRAGNEILNKALQKKADVNGIIAFLMKSVIDNLDNMISTLVKKQNNKAQPANLNY